MDRLKNPKWVRELLFMKLCIHGVASVLWYSVINYPNRELDDYIGVSYGRNLKYFYECDIVRKIKSKPRNFIEKIVQRCKNVPVISLGDAMWKNILMMNEDIYKEIDSDNGNSIEFSEMHLPSLLSIKEQIDGMVPIAAVFLLYSIGEILSHTNRIDLLDKWYGIIEKTKIDNLDKIIYSLKKSDLVIDIYIPNVILDIVVSYLTRVLIPKGELIQILLDSIKEDKLYDLPFV